MNTVDIAVIGAGPNGLYATKVLNDNFKNWKIICIEKGDIAQSLRSHPNVLWHSEMKDLMLPSTMNSKIKDTHQPTPDELVNYYSCLSEENSLEIFKHHNVEEISKIDNSYIITSIRDNKKILFRANYIILASGIFLNKNKLNIDILPNYCEYGFRKDFRNKNLVLVGSGNSATDFIVENLKYNKIHWVIRGDKWHIFYNVKHIFDTIIKQYKRNLKIYYKTEVKKFFENRSIELSNSQIIQNIDHCSILIGFRPFSRELSKWGLNFKNDCLVLNESNETNLGKIYAIGSLASKWNSNDQKINQTFVNNGNINDLTKVIESIKTYEVGKIFNFKRKSFNDLFPPRPLVERVINKLLKYVKK